MKIKIKVRVFQVGALGETEDNTFQGMKLAVKDGPPGSENYDHEVWAELSDDECRRAGRLLYREIEATLEMPEDGT